MLRVEGGWSAVVQVPQLRSEEALVLELLDEGRRARPSRDTSSISSAKRFSSSACWSSPALFDRGIARVLARAAGARRVRRRQSGISVPLFCDCLVDAAGASASSPICRSLRAGCQEAGQSLVQILPINEMPPIETSPYSAMTAMALDPIYITMPDVPDFAGLGGELALDGAEQAELDDACARPPRDVCAIGSPVEGALAAPRLRSLPASSKSRAARRGRRDSTHSAAAESWWLDDYALFRSLTRLHDERAWTDWPEPLARPRRRRSPTRAHRSRSRCSYRYVPPVDRRRAVGGGQAICRGRCACSAICRS